MNRLETLHPQKWSSPWPSYSSNIYQKLYEGNWPYYPANYGLEIIWHTLWHGLLRHETIRTIWEELR